MKHLINSFLYHPSKGGTRGLYPGYKPDQNPLIKSIGEIIFYLIKLVSLPVKIILRKNFGYRYFIPLDYILYSFILMIGVGILLIWTTLLPAWIAYEASNTFSLVWFIHFPFLSWGFVIWIIIMLAGRFKKEINKPIDKVPKHGNYPGENKLIQHFKSEDEKGVSDYIRHKVEPLICGTTGFLVLPLDHILATMLLLTALSLRIEIWHENREHKMAILDLTDGLIDALYIDWMHEKFQKCIEEDIPVEHIYKQITTEKTDKLHQKLGQKIPTEMKLLGLKKISSYRKSRIEKLLKDIL